MEVRKIEVEGKDERDERCYCNSLWEKCDKILNEIKAPCLARFRGKVPKRTPSRACPFFDTKNYVLPNFI